EEEEKEEEEEEEEGKRVLPPEKTKGRSLLTSASPAGRPPTQRPRHAGWREERGGMRRRRRRQGDKTPAGRQLGAAPGCSRPCRRVAGADAPSARAGPCACARGAVPTGEEGADGGAQRSGICLYLATTSTSSSSQPRKYLTSSPRLRGRPWRCPGRAPWKAAAQGAGPEPPPQREAPRPREAVGAPAGSRGAPR
ncbi:unnamed protein product, partial [Prorocentrum cordatum]